MKIFILHILILSSVFSNRYILVDLSEQRAYLKENGKIINSGRISSGKRGLETPTGKFKITEKKRHYRSTKYPLPNGGAKMPYMLRLSGSSYALHLGYVPNSPASHGCVRLENGFAQEVFKWASVGTEVRIVGSINNLAIKPNVSHRSKGSTQQLRVKKKSLYYEAAHDDYDLLEYYPETSDTGYVKIY